MLSIIGKLIKQLRTESDITIHELAERSGVSDEKLTEIESGSVTPSLGVLMKISRSLGSRLGTLLDGQESFGAVVTRARKGVESNSYAGADADQQEHMSFYSLAQGKNDRHMEPLVIEVHATDKEPDMRSEHEGEEFLFVLEGSVKVHYGEEIHLLERGDSIYYDSIVPHLILNASAEETQTAKILAVVYTPY